MSIAQQIYSTRFSYGHAPRSEEFKAGVLYILRWKAGELSEQQRPYALGTAQYDAWSAGCTEGHTLWAEHRESAQ